LTLLAATRPGQRRDRLSDEQRDQDDDGDRYAEEEQEQRSHNSLQLVM
jgi:hypothetical protein